MPSHAPSVLALCAGLAVCAANASGQFTVFPVGGIELDGVEQSSLPFDILGDLALGTRLPDSEFASLGLAENAVVTHTGDLTIGLFDSGSSTSGISASRPGASWTTTGNLLMGTVPGSRGRIGTSNGGTFTLNGDTMIGLGGGRHEIAASSGGTIALNGDVVVDTRDPLSFAGFLQAQGGSLSAHDVTLRGQGSRLIVQQAGSVSVHDLVVTDGGRITIREDTASFSASSITLSGAGSQLFIQNNNDTDPAVMLDVGLITISDGAVWDLDSRTSVNLTGTVNIESSAEPLQFDAGVNRLGAVTGDLTKLGHFGGHLAIGSDLTINADMNGLRSINSDESLEVGGRLTVNAPVNLSNNRSVVAGRLSVTDIAQFTGNDRFISSETTEPGGGTLTTTTLIINEPGDVTTTLTIPTNPNVTFTGFSDMENVGTALAGVFDNYSGPYTNAATGETRLFAGESAQLASVDNRGRFVLRGNDQFDGVARFFTPGQFHNADGATLLLDNGDFRAQGGLVNDGSVNVVDDLSTVFGTITNNASIIITQDHQLTLFDDLTNNGSIGLGNGATLTVFGTLDGAGTVGGGGVVNILGEFSVGNSPADVNWSTDLFLARSSTTVIEIAGTELGEFDRVSLIGDLSIAGALEVVLLDGFLLEENARFQIFAGDAATSDGGVFGRFRGLEDGALVGTFNGVDLFIEYDSALAGGGVTLFSVPAPGALTLLLGAGLGARRRRA